MYQGMGFAYIPPTGEPISSIGTQVVSAGLAAVSLIGKLFGWGEEPYDDFEREIRPLIAPKAQQTGQPVYVFWYGETVGVLPDGRRHVLAKSANSEESMIQLQRLANDTGSVVWGYFYGSFHRYDPASVLSTAGFSDAAGSDATWLVLGAVGLLALKGFRL